jgi:flagellar basal body-associated protein FliL
MSDEDLRIKTRNKLLTSTLDFEGVEDADSGQSALKDPFITTPDSMPASSRASRSARSARTAGNSSAQRAFKTSTPSAVSPRPPIRRVNKVSKVKQSEDRFTIYAAVIVLLSLIAITFSVYTFRDKDDNAAGLSYIELSQTLLNEEGLIARMKVNIQVDTGDAEWLQENKKALNDRFAEAATKLDLESLRTPEGFNAAQDELRRGLNKTFQTDKIQAVLLTDLLVQNQR